MCSEDEREGMFWPESKLAKPFADTGSTGGEANLEVQIKLVMLCDAYYTSGGNVRETAEW